MNRVATLGSLMLVAFAAGCTSDVVDYVDNLKERARDNGGRDRRGGDMCEAEGWYGDGICDDFCPASDPDCARCEALPSCDRGEEEHASENDCPQDSSCRAVTLCGTTIWCSGGGSTCGCAGPNPQGCVSSGCRRGQRCDTTQGDKPSRCACDAKTNAWYCTDDLGGGICVPYDTKECERPNPQGCISTGCREGQRCDTRRGGKPSRCACGEEGLWFCTDDLNGGICVDE